MEDRSREERIEITRHEFMRHLQQIVRSNVGKPNKPAEVSLRSSDVAKAKCKGANQPSYEGLVAPTVCQMENCFQPALPCTRHCTLHIMLNTDQVLFGYCTAKFADNTQCSVPVFDITHELPLCPEHARKRVNRAAVLLFVHYCTSIVCRITTNYTKKLNQRSYGRKSNHPP